MPFGRPGFDGEFRSRPLQSLGGFNRNGNRDRLSLIQEAASERRRREDMRRHVSFIQKFQNEIRRSLAYKRSKEHFREVFDNDLQKLVNTKNCDLIHLLVKQFAFFCDFTKPNITFDDPDAQRMILLTKFLLENHSLVVSYIQQNNPRILCRSFAKLFVEHIHLLGTIETYQLERYTPILQLVLVLFEIYLDPKNTSLRFVNSTWSLLVENQFFELLTNFLKTNPSCTELVFDGLISKPIFSDFDDFTNHKLRIRYFFQDFWIDFPLSNSKYQILDKICQIVQQSKPELLSASLLLEAIEVNIDFKGDSLGFITSFNAFINILSQVSKPLSHSELNIFLNVSQNFCNLLKKYVQQHEHFKFQAKSEDDCESDDEDHAESSFFGAIFSELDKIFKLFGSRQICDVLKTYCNDNLSQESMLALCTIGHNIILFSHSALYRNGFLQILSCRQEFLRQMWNFVLTEIATSERTFLSIVTNYTDFSQFQVDWETFLPTIVLFCALFSYTFKTLDDVEFFSELTNELVTQPQEDFKRSSAMAFKLNELIKMSSYLKDICISMVEFMFREMTNRDANLAFPMIDETPKKRDVFLLQSWNLLKRYSFKLLKHIYARNLRKRFCPENHWISSKVCFANFSPQVLSVSVDFRNQYFSHVFTTNTANIQNLRLPIPIRDIINMTIAQELPMVIPFEDRVRIFQSFIAHEKRNYDHENFHPTQIVLIRRSHFYEDSFEKLSKNNVSDIKKRIRIQLQSQLGLVENGIDGGGVFREFLSEVLRAAFDPNRAFFKVTSDGLLYPNPNIHVLMDNSLSGQHYYFIGRMLGKAIYENMLIDLPFAPFFLTKLLAKNLYSDVDINHLSSLDPEVYHNLISLKKYDKNVAELNLDFTHVSSELGVNIVTELKPNGANIAVTDSNRIEYIHRMADHKLNKQIRNQCADFKRGFYDVVSFDWIRMFDTNEIQVLISGAQVPINIDDLRNHTVYSCGYTADHPVILTFWETVSEFTDEEKKQLLKFITSCSRPPLLGFKDLYPKMCIQNCGNTDRLPTSSTCMNLLKLPEIRDKQTLKERLLYSINSNSGFELS